MREYLSEHADKEAARLLEAAQHLTDEKERAALFHLALLYIERDQAAEPSTAANRLNEPPKQRVSG